MGYFSRHICKENNLIFSYDSFIDHIEMLCRQRNLTLEELAAELGFSKDKFKKVYNQKSIIRATDLIKICEYLNITPNDIMY